MLISVRNIHQIFLFSINVPHTESIQNNKFVSHTGADIRNNMDYVCVTDATHFVFGGMFVYPDGRKILYLAFWILDVVVKRGVKASMIDILAASLFDFVELRRIEQKKGIFHHTFRDRSLKSWYRTVSRSPSGVVHLSTRQDTTSICFRSSFSRNSPIQLLLSWARMQVQTL